MKFEYLCIKNKVKKNEKGSISIFVLVALLFMSAVLIISYASNVNKSKVAQEQFNIISGIYSKGNDAQSYTDAYTYLRKRNKQTLTATSEGTDDTASLELTKTYEDKVGNYRIYGNGGLNLFNPDAEPTKIGAYLGIDLTGTNTNYTLYIKLKENKTVPEEAYFGFVYKTNESSAYNAYWNITNGNLSSIWEYGTTYSLTKMNTSEVNSVGICCYPGNQTIWDSIIDAFDIFLVEGRYSLDALPEYEEYGIGVGDAKNLYDINSVPNISYNETIQKYVINTTASFEEGQKIYLEAGTYTFSYIKSLVPGQSWSASTLWVYYEDGTLLSQYDKGTSASTIAEKITITESGNYVFALGGYKNYSSYFGSTAVEKVMLEKSEVATEYEEYGKYKIPIKVSGNDVESQTFNIYLDEPLKYGEYIDFKLGKVIRVDGREESIDLSEFLIYEDYTKIEVLTEVKPSKIEVEYVGYSLD